MTSYIIRRLLLAIPTFIIATVIVFFTVRFIPGDTVTLMLAQAGSEGTTKFTEEKLREAMGLNVPVHVQYARWFVGIFRGDLGMSLWTGMSVRETIWSRMSVSAELGILAIISAILIALPIGIYSAIRQDTPGDYLGRTVAILFISLPSFWLGTMVVVFPSIWWGWAPSVDIIRFWNDPLANLVQFIIPAVIMGMVMSGGTMRMTRTMMLEVLRQDYIRTAWSKGLGERTVILRHALKNALIPVVTMIGLQIPIVISGAVVMETIFVLPGVGLLEITAIQQRDYPIISGVNVVLAIFVLIVNLLVDLTYAYLDPRVVYH